MSVPLVSVLLSTFNRADRLRFAIDSVLAQDYPRLEVVLVNDAATDETEDVVAAYRGDPRLKVILNRANLGLVRSLNIGLRAAEGEYVARIDDDDRWIDSGKLSRQVAYLDSHPDVAVVGTAYIDESGTVVRNPETDQQIRSQMLLRCPFCHSSVLMRRKELDKEGGYDEQFCYAEDWDLWLRIGLRYRMANLPSVSVSRSQNHDTMSRMNFHRQLGIAREFVSTYGASYPHRRLAALYHWSAQLFFRLFTVGGKAHGLASRFYVLLFLRRSG